MTDEKKKKKKTVAYFREQFGMAFELGDSGALGGMVLRLFEIIEDLQKELSLLRIENNSNALLIAALHSENDKLTKERDDARADANYMKVVAGVK